MKIAIIGGGIGPLLCAKRFRDLGAHVTLFLHQERALFYQGLTGPLRDLYGDTALKEYEALIHELGPLIRFMPKEVEQVSKRLLTPGLGPRPRSEMQDLFRIHYWSRPQQGIETDVKGQLKSKGELPQELKDDLKRDYLNYEDFDSVINADNSPFYRHRAGGGDHKCLNEDRAYRKGEVTYLGNGEISFESKRPLIVGDGAMAASILLSFSKDLLGGKSQATIVTQYSRPFSKIPPSDPLSLKVRELFDKLESNWKNKLKEFEALDPRMASMKERPHLGVQLFTHSKVALIDHLSDREETFVTIESYPDLLDPKRDTHTSMALDQLYIAHEGLEVQPHWERPLLVEVRPESRPLTNIPGYYHLPSFDLFASTSTPVIAMIDEVQKDLMTFFSRKES